MKFLYLLSAILVAMKVAGKSENGKAQSLNLACNSASTFVVLQSSLVC